jgi:hypothetical protein
VTNLCYTLVEFGMNRIAADGFEGGSAHKLKGSSRRNDINVVAIKHKSSNNTHGLVRSNAARYANDNAKATSGRGGHFRPKN